MQKENSVEALKLDLAINRKALIYETTTFSMSDFSVPRQLSLTISLLLRKIK